MAYSFGSVQTYFRADGGVDRISNGISITGFRTAAAAQFFADFPAWRQLHLGAPPPRVRWLSALSPPGDAGGRGGAGTTARYGQPATDDLGGELAVVQKRVQGPHGVPGGNRGWVNSALRPLPPSSTPPRFVPRLDRAWMGGSTSIIAADGSPARLAIIRNATSPFCVGNCTATVRRSFPDASEFQIRPRPRRGPRV
ncbi:hypothetical protein DL767_006304 [Monosporascus sp. MG133]|nr:hypothetical protein DL767_006304 [Monosporascus sp. MG133]